MWTPIIIATAAGPIGRVSDAIAAFDVLRTRFPPFLDPANVRALWALWTWEPNMVERFVAGFLEAKALVENTGRAGGTVPRAPEA